jgi:hypothetical protein
MLTLCPYFIPQDGESLLVQKRRRAYLSWFVNTYPAGEFQKEELVLFHYLKFADIYEAPLSDKTLESFCSAELRGIIIKEKIRVTGTAGFDFADIGQLMSAVDVTKQALIEMMEEAHSKDTSESEFVMEVNMWLNVRMTDRMYDAMNEGSAIIESMNKGLTGPHDANIRMLQRMVELSTLYSKDTLKDIIELTDDDEQFSFSFNTGITPLDQVTGGIFTTELISIEAPPGIGKSKFAVCQLMWRAAVMFKKSCLFYSLEQTKKELESLLVARHYFYLYNQVMDEATLRIQNNYERLPPEIKQNVEAARDDLFNNPEYGKIELVCTTLAEDSLIAHIRRMNNLKGPFDVTFVDYMGLVQGSSTKWAGRRSYETIGDCLMELKAYARASNTVVVAVNQLGAEGTERARAGKGAIESGAQGGMIVYRSTDKNMVISCTDEQKAQHKRSIELTKGRGVRDLITVVCSTKLCMGLFFVEMKEIEI